MFFVPINMFRGYFFNGGGDICNEIIAVIVYTAYKNWHGTS